MRRERWSGTAPRWPQIPSVTPTTAVPHSRSGTPTTEKTTRLHSTHQTYVQARAARSTAARSTLMPPEMTTSSTRPVTDSRPSSPSSPRSWVRSRGPMERLARVRSGRNRYPEKKRNRAAAEQDAVVPRVDLDRDVVQRYPVVDAAAAGLSLMPYVVTTARPLARARWPAAPGRRDHHPAAPRRSRLRVSVTARVGAGPGGAGSGPARGSGGRSSARRHRLQVVQIGGDLVHWAVSASRPRASTIRPAT